jgi:hypothetical protein
MKNHLKIRFENGFEPWVVPLIEISTIKPKPRSSTEKVSHTNFS